MALKKITRAAQWPLVAEFTASFSDTAKDAVTGAVKGFGTTAAENLVFDAIALLHNDVSAVSMMSSAPCPTNSLKALVKLRHDADKRASHADQRRNGQTEPLQPIGQRERPDGARKQARQRQIPDDRAISASSEQGERDRAARDGHEAVRHAERRGEGAR